MTTLILAEKPSQAATYARVFGGYSGTYQGTSYKIANSVGHLMALIEPKMVKGDYSIIMDAEHAKTFNPWNANELPWKTTAFNFRRAPYPATKDVLRQIKKGNHA